MTQQQNCDDAKSDDLVKLQGLTVKYSVPVLDVMPENIVFGPITPSVTILVESIDDIIPMMRLVC